MLYDGKSFFLIFQFDWRIVNIALHETEEF